MRGTTSTVIAPEFEDGKIVLRVPSEVLAKAAYPAVLDPMILGESAAVVYDARRATATAAGAPVLGATDIRMHVLPAGSSFDPRTGLAHLP